MNVYLNGMYIIYIIFIQKYRSCIRIKRGLFVETILKLNFFNVLKNLLPNILLVLIYLMMN